MSDDTEFNFAPDFTARVLARADRMAVRTVRRRRLALAAAAAASVALIVWAAVPDGSTDPRPSVDVPRLVAMQLQDSTIRRGEPDAVGDLFPDAEPVARFAAQYSDADAPATDLLGDEDAGTP